ncbi:MAG: efflux RND transporter periplasmic adaptor subunit [Bacteroidetes bacterium]|nr:efflux RND transporter periplasmic adaptor subunit [Bacteroidota bacterium]MBS1740256.1 efflux RND transporter periplasmic adaptor subunit [Bacteroidota bacterium]
MSNRKIWWIVGCSIILLIILIIIGKLKGDKGLKVAVEKVSLHDITETVSASGKIYPESEVKISPEVSGEIIELNIAEGDSVHKGELLVRINPAIYGSMVNQAEATVEESRARMQNAKEMVAQTKASFDQAKLNYERNQKLFKEKVISALEFEQSESTFRSTKAAFEAAQATLSGGEYNIKGTSAGLSQARENLRKTTIIAPTSGIISALNVKLGERVVGTAQMAGTEMLTIADMGRIEVRVDVSETDITKVKLGDTTEIEADAYRNKKFIGVVSKISVSSKATGTQQLSTDQVTNYTVRILILQDSYADLLAQNTGKFPFKPGMSASVEIHTHRERNVLSIPVNAVTTRDFPDSLKKVKANSDQIRQVVFVYDNQTQKVKLRDVQTGIQNNEYIQITAGLKEGEEVVIAPYGAIARTLKENMEVIKTDKAKLFESKENKL